MYVEESFSRSEPVFRRRVVLAVSDRQYYSLPPLISYICQVGGLTGLADYTQHPCKIIARFDSYQNKLLSCMGVEYNQPAHLLDRYIKGGDINGGRLYLAQWQCVYCRNILTYLLVHCRSGCLGMHSQEILVDGQRAKIKTTSFGFSE